MATKQWTAPKSIRPHAVERFIERWQPTGALASVDVVMRFDGALALLESMLPHAVFVEEDRGHRTAIWALNQRQGPPVLLVVNGEGAVETVLPRGAQRPDRRHGVGPTPEVMAGQDLVACPFCGRMLGVNIDEGAVFHAMPMCDRFLRMEPDVFVSACVAEIAGRAPS